MQPSLPKNRKGPNKSFIEDAAVLFGSEGNVKDYNVLNDDDLDIIAEAWGRINTNHILTTWINIVWVHPIHNYLSLIY